MEEKFIRFIKGIDMWFSRVEHKMRLFAYSALLYMSGFILLLSFEKASAIEILGILALMAISFVLYGFEKQKDSNKE